MGFSHLVAVMFVNVKGLQGVHVVVDNMTVTVVFSVTVVGSVLMVVHTTVVVNTLVFLSVLVSAVILVNKVVVTVHIFVGQVLMTGVCVSGTFGSTEHSEAAWPSLLLMQLSSQR